SGVRSFRVTQELVREPARVLAALLGSGEAERRRREIERVHAFAEKFFEERGARLVFSAGAAEHAVARAREAGQPIEQWLGAALRDYEFGLALIRKNGGPEEFEITPEVLDNPDGALSRAVVESYRASPPASNGGQQA
ncbi:MAG: hypothetical protein N2322_05890, partial [Terrimicrobiaceae bacterium]|nr:hypothetical protein [Terrimicrobiaceae bacterium]